MPIATIIGGPVSPYVRKVMAVCDLKGVAWCVDPIIPFQGNDAFTRISPLRSVPVFIDDAVTLADSTAICEYLDERYPAPPLLPKGPAARAQARWLEEFADTRMGDVFMWRLFNDAVIRPGVWKQPRDEAAIAATLAEHLPGVMDYLETVAPAEGFVFGDLSLADIAVAVPFANLAWSRVEADLTAWPNTVAWVERTEATPPLARLTMLGARFLATRVAERAALFAELEVTMSPVSHAGEGFRRGPMTV